MNVLKWPLLLTCSFLGATSLTALAQEDLPENLSSLLEEIAPARIIEQNTRRNLPSNKFIKTVKSKVLQDEIFQTSKVKIIIPRKTIITNIQTDIDYKLPKEIIAWAHRKVDHDKYVYLIGKDGKHQFKVQQRFVFYLGKTYELSHRPDHFTPVNQSIKKPDPSRQAPKMLVMPFLRYEQGAIPRFYDSIAENSAPQMTALGTSLEFELDIPVNLGALVLYRNVLLNDTKETTARFLYLGAQGKYVLSEDATRAWKLGLSFLFSPWAQVHYFEDGNRETAGLNSSAMEISAELSLKKWYKLNISLGLVNERSSLKDQQNFASSAEDSNAQRIFFQVGKQFSL